MKKYLSIFVGLIIALNVVPVYALNDLTLQTSAQISAGATFTVTGNYTMDSITVNADNFTVTLSPGGSLTVTAPGGTPISASHSDGITADRVCSSAESRMQLVAKSTAGAETVSISTGGSCGGSSGGSSNVTTTATTDTATTTVTTDSTTTTTVAPSTTITTTPVVSTPVVSTPVSTVSVYTFAIPLKLGSTGTDVTELQNKLTAEGVYSGPVTGYFGSLTQAAVKKYQAKYGIDQLGNVGPVTRAQLNSSVAAIPAQTSAETQSSAVIQQAIDSLLAQVQALQAQLLQLLTQQLQTLTQ